MSAIIGISGPARCGKDTFASSLVSYFYDQGIKSIRMALADELKWEARDFIMKTLGIDVFTERDEEKAIIRPFLVFWGTEIRRKMNENVWIEKLQENAPSDSVIIVSDVRYPNEQDWIIESGGFSIFIDRVLEDGNILDGANDHERKYNPILREKCNHHLSWGTVLDKESGQQIIDTIVDDVARTTIPQTLIDQWKVTYSL